VVLWPAARQGRRRTGVNILDAEVLETPARGPRTRPGRLLAGVTRRYESSVYTATATVRMTAEALQRMEFVFPPEMSRVARSRRARPTRPGGW